MCTRAAFLGLLSIAVTAQASVVIVNLPGLSSNDVEAMPQLQAIVARGVMSETGISTAFGGDLFPAAQSMITGHHPNMTGVYADSMYDSTLDQTFTRGQVSAGKPGVAALADITEEQRAAWMHGRTLFETAAEYRMEVVGGWPGYGNELTLGDAAINDALARNVSLILISDSRLTSEPVDQSAVLQTIDAALGALYDTLATHEIGDLIIVSHSGRVAVEQQVTLPNTPLASTSGSFPRFFYSDDNAALTQLQADVQALSNVVSGTPDTLPEEAKGEFQRRVGDLYVMPQVNAAFEQANVLTGYSGDGPQSGFFVATGVHFRANRTVPSINAVDIYPLLSHLTLLPPVDDHAGSLKHLKKYVLTSRGPYRGHFAARRVYMMPRDMITVMPPTSAEFMTGIRFDLNVQLPYVLPGTAADKTFTWSMTRNGEAYEPELACIKDRALNRWTYRATKSHDSYLVRGCEFTQAGKYVFRVTSGLRETSVSWSVRDIKGEGAKNVVLFIGDGMSIPMVTAARALRGGKRLAVDDFESYGTAFTHSLDSIITDSSTSASAINSGHKTLPGMSGHYPDGTEGTTEMDDFDNPRVELAAEYFRRKYGAKIGVVSTASILDATPAAVWAHFQDRSKSEMIAMQSLQEQPDVLLGGGSGVYDGTSGWSQRDNEKRSLVSDAEELGYTFVNSLTEMNRVAQTGGKMIGLFNEKHMSLFVDRVGSEDEPNLSQMTLAALTSLYANKDRFYIQIEAASIDKQAHANDYVRMIGDTLELHACINETINWLEEKGILDETLIVVTSDHTTGGYDVYGTADTDAAREDVVNTQNYTKLYGYSEFPDWKVDESGYHVKNWKEAQWTLAGLHNHHPQGFFEDFKFHPLGANERALRPREGQGMPVSHLVPSTSSSVHTVSDVLVYAHGKGSSHFKGCHDQTHIFFGLIDAMAPKEPSASVDTSSRQGTSLQTDSTAQQQATEPQVCKCEADNVSTGETVTIVLLVLATLVNAALFLSK